MKSRCSLGNLMLYRRFHDAVVLELLLEQLNIDVEAFAVATPETHVWFDLEGESSKSI